MTYIKHTLDASAITAAFSSFLGWFPPVASLIASILSAIWLGVQLHDRFIKNKDLSD